MSTESELQVVKKEQESQDGTIQQSVDLGFRISRSAFMPSAELKGYEEVASGSARELVAVFLEQARHRMEMESNQSQNNRLQLENERLQIESQSQNERLQIEKEYDLGSQFIKAEQNDRRLTLCIGTVGLLGFMLLALAFASMGLEGAAIVSILVPVAQIIGDWIDRLTKGRKNNNDGNS